MTESERTATTPIQARTWTRTFINLPVRHLERTTEFFTELGFGFDPRVQDENTTCMIISESSSVMLHVEPYFKEFTNGAVADTSTSREVVIGLSTETRDEVDDLVDTALVAGAEDMGAAQDDGFVYMRAFRDLDGHQWSFIHFDMSAFQQG